MSTVIATSGRLTCAPQPTPLLCCAISDTPQTVTSSISGLQYAWLWNHLDKQASKAAALHSLHPHTPCAPLLLTAGAMAQEVLRQVWHQRPHRQAGSHQRKSSSPNPLPPARPSSCMQGAWRKKFLDRYGIRGRIAEALVVSLVTSIVSFSLPLMVPCQVSACSLLQ